MHGTPGSPKATEVVELVKTLPLPRVAEPTDVPIVHEFSVPTPPALLQDLEAKRKLIPGKAPIKGDAFVRVIVDVGTCLHFCSNFTSGFVKD
jgi:hypothetical protein